MSFYLPHIHATDEHRWQRYNICLDENALADVCAFIEAAATNSWSFRLIHSPASNPVPFDPVYVFFFREASDVIVLRKFDASRRRL